jgi:uncharacterized protein
MLSNDIRPLCVSIHDVAPYTWDACRRLIHGVREVADIPLTLLVVPNYHRQGELPPAEYIDQLSSYIDAGYELALHGYTHLDEEPIGLLSKFQRTILTRREGEFSALSQNQAALHLQLGQDWFKRRGWPVAGFVAPAWLMGRGAWGALNQFSFTYTTTMHYFYILPSRISLWSPALLFSSQGEGLYQASIVRNKTLQRLLMKRPLIRLSLHPPDARPHVMREWQYLLHDLLENRTPMTKAQFAGVHAAPMSQSC